jgi:hypothetical protein
VAKERFYSFSRGGRWYFQLHLSPRFPESKISKDNEGPHEVSTCCFSYEKSRRGGHAMCWGVNLRLEAEPARTSHRIFNRSFWENRNLDVMEKDAECWRRGLYL